MGERADLAVLEADDRSCHDTLLCLGIVEGIMVGIWGLNGSNIHQPFCTELGEHTVTLTLTHSHTCQTDRTLAAIKE